MTSAELVDAIDEQDTVLGTYERGVAIDLGLALRVSGVLLFSSRATIFLQQRSRIKKYPLCYDYSAAGHVQSGEDYLTAAHRELAEELGVHATLEHVSVLRMRTEAGRLKKLHHVFTARHDGPFTLFADEVQDVHEFYYPELCARIATSPELFTPSFRVVFEHVITPSLFKA